MKPEQIIEQLVAFATEREYIRTVVLNGSLVNPNIRPDPYQDVDLAFYVEDVQAVATDRSWIDMFGEVLIMQTPETSDPERHVTFLVQYVDGHRLDLTIRRVDQLEAMLESDSLSQIIFDRDDHPDVTPSDTSYRVKHPSADEYAACWNEFWWVSLYVVKGIKRHQVLYALDHLDIMRNMLRQMMEWNIGYATDFSVNLGKSGDGMRDHLPEELWEMLGATYASAELSAIEDTHDRLQSLFFFCAQRVAEQGHFVFQEEEARRVRAACATLRHSND
ncbi:MULTISPECIES: aminoglycoside 6-adenylyltransferase [unclassified Exiguobacterium]|uniref:aminoglycoside 6-adenylyltransferase n=1 Tax=unclassified Exiguobacterium TaxID=2644629 RepID=UPI001BEAF514|nr:MULTISPECIES: aminoglycoside 6-adenylyltransferase [unclassified Exiguobacterium]